MVKKRLLTRKQVKEKVGYSDSHRDRLESAGRFPLRAKPNGPQGRAFWDEAEIDQWIDNQLARR